MGSQLQLRTLLVLVSLPILLLSEESAPFLRTDPRKSSVFDTKHLHIRELRQELPSSFDSRDSGWISPAKAQGSCGGCWTFATTGALESYYLKRWGIEPNFSEYHILSTNGFSVAQCDGGTPQMTISYLNRSLGPVDEDAYAPYPYAQEVQPRGEVVIQPYVRDALFIPPRSSSTDNTSLKEALVAYGSVFVNFYSDPTLYYDSTTNTYYYNGSDTISSNHAVLLIGWDDNKTTQAPTAGAWLIKNSNGSSWGEEGAFWIAYEDTKLGTETNMVLDSLVAASTYNDLFYYDTLGNTGQIGLIQGVDSAWGSAHFTARSVTSIGAIGTYFLANGSTVTIEIYSTITYDGSQAHYNNLLLTTTATRDYAGYYTITLKDTLSFSAGEEFAVVVRYKTPAYDSPLPIEHLYPGYTESATAQSRQTYYSSDGSTFTDMITVDTSVSLCLRALSIGVVDSSHAFINKGLLAQEGALTPLSITDLKQFSSTHDSAIVYHITSLPHFGRVVAITDTTQELTSFTQNDLRNQTIGYLHNGSETTEDSLYFYYTDTSYQSDTLLFAITISSVNDTPTITLPFDTLTLEVDDTLRAQVEATDSDLDDTLIFSLEGPTDMTISDQGEMVWIVPDSALQENICHITVTDRAGVAVTDSCTLFVEQPTPLLPQSSQESTELFLAYPNPLPLTSSRSITFTIPTPLVGEVTFSLYDALGHLIEYQTFNRYSLSVITWDITTQGGQKVSTGAYRALLTGRDITGAYKMYSLMVGVQL